MTTTTLHPALALRVRQASRTIGTRPLLRDVGLDVDRGALVVLAGANGAGKSSLLRAIGGRLRLDTGAITIDGLDAVEGRRLGRLGVVPQDIALDAHLTVAENLRLWARLAGTARADIQARLAAGLVWAGLSGRERSRVDTLSGGMRRRVNLLAGLLHRPALLLLDEPTAGVDHAARRQFYGLLDDLRQQGVGILLATHDLDEASETADVVVVMDGGSVVTRGSVGELTARYGGADGEIVVTLATDADARADSALAGRGFPSVPGRDRARPASDADRDLRGLARDLAADGVSVQEVRWRRATLQTAVSAAVASHREARS